MPHLGLPYLAPVFLNQHTFISYCVYKAICLICIWRVKSACGHGWLIQVSAEMAQEGHIYIYIYIVECQIMVHFVCVNNGGRLVSCKYLVYGGHSWKGHFEHIPHPFRSFSFRIIPNNCVSVCNTYMYMIVSDSIGCFFEMFGLFFSQICFTLFGGYL